MNEQLERLAAALDMLDGLEPDQLHSEFDRGLLSGAIEVIGLVITDLKDGL